MKFFLLLSAIALSFGAKQPQNNIVPVDPTVSGSCLNTVNPHTYSFTISGALPSLDVYFSVYLDNGDHVFDAGTDQLLWSVAPANAVHITPGNPYFSGSLNYPNPLASTQRIFVVVTVVGRAYSTTGEILPCPSGGPLPVTLTDFTAVAGKGGVLLNWATASEENNAGFEIQKSVTADFAAIGFENTKAINGNSSSTLSYDFVDKNTTAGISYYRLKQTNLDGRFTYSEIRKVYGNNDKSHPVLIAPNPAVNKITHILLPFSFGQTDIAVINVSGVTVKAIRNSYQKNIELAGMPSGIYMVKVTDRLTNSVYTEKLIVQ